MKLGDLLEMPNDDTPASCRTPERESQEMAAFHVEAELAKRRLEVIEWLNSLSPGLNMPLEVSEEELQARLLDGVVLCDILRKFSPGYFDEIRNDAFVSTENNLENVRIFISAVEQIGLPGFSVSDLQQLIDHTTEGPTSAVVYCLWSLKDHLISDFGEDKDMHSSVKNGEKTRMSPKAPSGQNYIDLGEGRRDRFQNLRSQRFLQNSVMSEPSTPESHNSGHAFHEVFQLKQGRYFDLPSAKICEILKSSSSDHVACLLKNIMEDIERRIATQAEHIGKQSNLIKAREEKYHSRIRVLETLATGTNEETQIVMNLLQLLKSEKHKIEEKNKLVAEDMDRLMKEKETNENIISELKQELVTIKKTCNEQFLHTEIKAKEYQVEMEQKLKHAASFVAESQNRIKELENLSESKFHNWNRREHVFRSFIDLLVESVQELRSSSDSFKHEFKITQKKWCEDLTSFRQQLKVLVDTVDHYHNILAENRRLYNEVQELKGNIRVYCRIRPFLPGKNKRQTTIDYVGENGELLLSNPSKQGKGQRMFKFNKIFGPEATQEEVFLDTQPLVRSVLDGYSVCIFAYGQTGSGKTYTMTGPSSANEKDWGVNYRALNDLFHISQNRRDTYFYEVGAQMVEIYNEQVCDLHEKDSSQKKLGILTNLQPNGLSVPEASLHSVKSASDVLELMQIGHNNRVVGATALNERSSRSHSILTVHVRGTDLNTGDTLRGSLHLIYLAGSERVDRSEVTGDRLKEAQHINKSLSALGDVIFSLSQKSFHVPYRNSKLTQLLQSSLGGHAKTLMFVQINPDIASYSETLSTLKFAERVSGVELGAAKSQKEGKDIRDLMEQVASLRDIIERKDKEIEQLQQIKGSRSRQKSNSSRHSSSSPGGIPELGVRIQKEMKLTKRRRFANNKVVSHHENCSKHSESGSQQRTDDKRHQRENLEQTKFNRGAADHISTDRVVFSFGDADSDERPSATSDGVLSVATETDASICNHGDAFPEQVKSSETPQEKESRNPSKVPKPSSQKAGQVSATQTISRDITKPPSARKRTSRVTTVKDS